MKALELAATVGPVRAPATTRLSASAWIRAASDGGGITRLREVRSDPPLVLRRTGRGQVHLVAVGGGPVAGDELTLRVEVGDGAQLGVHQLAATVALPSPVDLGPSRSRIEVTVGRGAHLDWWGQPTVAARGCNHEIDLEIQLEADASMRWREEVVAGRCGETSGRVRSRLLVRREGRLLVRCEGTVGGTDWASPAVAGGARVHGTMLLAGEPARGVGDRQHPAATVSTLADEMVIGTALGDDHPSVRTVLDDVALVHPHSHAASRSFGEGR